MRSVSRYGFGAHELAFQRHAALGRPTGRYQRPDGSCILPASERTAPKKRPPREVWESLRIIVFERDGGRCVRCSAALTIETAHVDHIVSGKLGTNELRNLRLLCRKCHVLWLDKRHRGMIAGALRDGVIPPNWRELVWED